MEMAVVTIFCLGVLVKSKLVWILAAVLVIVTLFSPPVGQYLPYLFLLFVPGLLFFWISISLYRRRFKDEDYFTGRGVTAALRALQGDMAGTAAEFEKAFQPGWLSRTFFKSGYAFLHLPMAALLALTVAAVLARTFRFLGFLP